MTMIVRCLLALMSLGLTVWAQELTLETATVKGRVMRGDKPAFGVIVVAQRAGQMGGWRTTNITTRTDANGNYQLAGLAAGSYSIVVSAVAEIVKSDASPLQRGKAVVVHAGELIDGIDFSLVKGGVITGTITDENGKPVVGEEVKLRSYVMKGRSYEYYNSGGLDQMRNTDDRGVYRIFGLPPGKYLVRVGQDQEGSFLNAKSYPLTFYPSVTEEVNAKVVDVSEGGEATGIDIKLPQQNTLYVASGRVIDATTDAPVAGVRLGFNAVLNTEDRFGGGGVTRAATTAQGEFQLPRLRPGKYLAYLRPEEGSEFYSDPINFEIIGGDISGLELKALRGSSISGIVVIEGTKDPKLLASASAFTLGVRPDVSRGQVPAFGGARINPDGSFRLNGIAPGNVNIVMSFGGLGVRLPDKIPVLLRIEKDGVELPKGVPVNAGEDVTGVRVIFGYGTATVRGQVYFTSGALPLAGQLQVFMQRMKGAAVQSGHYANVDANGRFLFEGLQAGDYQLYLFPPPAMRPRLSAAIQQRLGKIHPLTITADSETPITLTVDLQEEGKQ